jgi:hypothetical protein
MKEKNGENKKAGKNWMDDEILHLITRRNEARICRKCEKTK